MLQGPIDVGCTTLEGTGGFTVYVLRLSIGFMAMVLEVTSQNVANHFPFPPLAWKKHRDAFLKIPSWAPGLRGMGRAR